MARNLRVVNVETGEISTEHYARHVNQDAAYKKSQLVGTDTRHFSFTNMRHITEITGDLSNTYCGYIVMLQPHIAMNTNVLVDGGEPIKRKELAEALKVNPRTIKTVVTKLKDRDIISEQDDGTFIINERYHFRKKAGNDVDVLIKTFFSALKKYNVKPADLGFVYKLLPNVHYDTNIICADPFVENAADVRYLNEKQIAKVVGMSESKAKDSLDRLRKSGIIRISIGKDKRENLTVLNPYVFYRKKGFPDKSLQAQFSAQPFEG